MHLLIVCVHSSYAIILKRKRKLVALLLLSYRCIVTIDILWLFLIVPWVGLQYVIVVFPDHTHLLFDWNCSGILFKNNLDYSILNCINMYGNEKG